ncbi:MAG: Ig-like domain-containing protein [Bacteroidota bacterium]
MKNFNHAQHLSVVPFTRNMLLLFLFFLLMLVGASGSYAQPTLNSSTPTNNATGVNIKAKLTLTFDQNVKKGTFDKYIRVYRYADDRLQSTLETAAEFSNTINGAAVTANINRLAPNVQYYVLIDAGAYLAVSDDSEYAGITDKNTLTFTTGSHPLASSSTNAQFLTSFQGTTDNQTEDVLIKFDRPVIEPDNARFVTGDPFEQSDVVATNATVNNFNHIDYTFVSQTPATSATLRVFTEDFYFEHRGIDKVYKIDRKTGSVLADITINGVTLFGSGIFDLAVSNDKLYVLQRSFGSEKVDRYDFSLPSNFSEKTIRLPNTVTGGRAEHLAVSPDGSRVCVVEYAQSQIVANSNPYDRSYIHVFDSDGNSVSGGYINIARNSTSMNQTAFNYEYRVTDVVHGGGDVFYITTTSTVDTFTNGSFNGTAQTIGFIFNSDNLMSEGNTSFATFEDISTIAQIRNVTNFLSKIAWDEASDVLYHFYLSGSNQDFPDYESYDLNNISRGANATLESGRLPNFFFSSGSWPEANPSSFQYLNDTLFFTSTSYLIPPDRYFEVEVSAINQGAVALNIAAGATANLVGGNTNSAASFNYNFGPADNTIPSVTVFNPSSGATTIVDPDIGTISLTFNENVVFTGRMTLRNDDNLVVKNFDAGTSDVVVSGSTITFNNLPQLEDNKLHYMQYDTRIGTIADISGNVIPTWSRTVWQFVASSTGDIEKPFVQSFIPASNSKHVSVEVDVEWTFNEDIFVGSGSVFLRKNNTNPPVASFDINDPEVNITENVLTIDLPLLDHSSDYELYTLAPGFVVDAVGNEMNQLSSLRFTTAAVGVNPDLLITGSNPEDNDTDFNRADNLVITFTEPVQFGSGFASIRTYDDFVTRVLFRSDGTGSNTASISGNVLTLDPDVLLDPNEDYYFEMQQGFIKDLSGNDFHGFPNTERDEFNFSTPLPISGSPTDINLSSTSINENEAARTAVGTFSTVDANSSDLEVYTLTGGSGDDDNASFVINGDQLETDEIFDFETKSSYSIRVRSDDNNGGVFEKVFTITILNDVGDDPIPPTRQTIFPADNATGVSASTDLIITFDRPVQKGTTGLGRIFIFPSSGSIQINRSSNRVQVTGNTVTIDPEDDLLPNETYNVTWDAGTFESIDGAPDEGILAFGLWNFTTAGAEINEWNGSNWSLGFPSASDNVILLADYDFSSEGDLEVNDLSTANLVDVNVESGFTLTVNGDLQIAGNGSLTVESGASLITFEGANMSGNVTVKRRPTFGTMNNSDGRYSVVSVPLNTSNVPASSIGELVYEFDENQESNASNGYSQVADNSQLDQGKGYFVAFSPEELSFSGQPAVGTILEFVPTPQNSGFHLVGNPYTAAISINEFFNDNPFASSIAIWDDGGALGGSQQSGAYIQVNDAGSVTNSSNLNGNTFNGHIGVAQGFFVETISQGNIGFTETQRVGGRSGDANFFREEDLYKRLKLTLSSSEGSSETLLATHPSATAAFDLQKDAKLKRVESAVELYSVMDDQAMAIQTFAEAPDLSMHLGYRAEKEDNYELLVQDSDFGGIIVRDSFTQQSHSLFPGESFTFDSNEGSFSDRFTVYLNGPILAIERFVETIVFGSPNELKIRGEFAGNQPITILDMSGRKVYTAIASFNNKQAAIQTNLLQDKVYILQIGEEAAKFVLK